MKNYVCEFCEFVTPLFNNLKLHIKKNHLEAPPVRKPRRGHKQQDEEDAEAQRAHSEHSVLNETNRFWKKLRIIRSLWCRILFQGTT